MPPHLCSLRFTTHTHTFPTISIISSMSQIQFTSLHNQAGLVSLEAARCNPSIVYRSLDIMYPSPAPTPAPIALPQTQGTFKLIPLAAAQAKAEIKYRSEGFEMKEARQCYLRLRMERWSQW